MRVCECASVCVRVLCLHVCVCVCVRLCVLVCARARNVRVRTCVRPFVRAFVRAHSVKVVEQPLSHAARRRTSLDSQLNCIADGVFVYSKEITICREHHQLNQTNGD